MFVEHKSVTNVTIHGQGKRATVISDEVTGGAELPQFARQVQEITP